MFVQLTSEELEAVTSLQDKIISPQVLASPRHGGAHFLDAADCRVQASTVLLDSEEEKGTSRPVAY